MKVMVDACKVFYSAIFVAGEIGVVMRCNKINVLQVVTKEDDFFGEKGKERVS